MCCRCPCPYLTLMYVSNLVYLCMVRQFILVFVVFVKRYHGDWRSETQTVVSLLAFMHWLETGTLLMHSEAEEMLGCMFAFTLSFLFLYNNGVLFIHLVLFFFFLPQVGVFVSAYIWIMLLELCALYFIIFHVIEVAKTARTHFPCVP